MDTGSSSETHTEYQAAANIDSLTVVVTNDFHSIDVEHRRNRISFSGKQPQQQVPQLRSRRRRDENH